MSTTSKLMRRFETACKSAENYNSRTRSKRFHPISHTHNNRVVEIGMYDAKYKKYAIADIRHYSMESVLDEIEEMINT